MSLSKSYLLSACLVYSCVAMDNPIKVVFNGSCITTNPYISIVSKKENDQYIITRVRQKRAYSRKETDTNINLIIPSIVDKLQVSIAPMAFKRMLKRPRRATVLVSIQFQSVDGNHVEYPEDCSELFAESTSITDIDISGLNPNQVIETTQKMFYGCTRLKSIKFGDFATTYVTNMGKMFKNCKSLQNLDLSCFDTSNVQNMHWMFSGCISLTDLNIRLFDTSRVQQMEYMFKNCKNLSKLNVNNFDTSHVISMKGMFLNCKTLQQLDLNTFNTSQVTSMNRMFDGCRNLISIGIEKFDTSNVRNMAKMFKDCYNLSHIPLNGFSASYELCYLSSMFANCRSVAVIYMPSSFYPKSNVICMDRMFCGCINLSCIICSKEWNFEKDMNFTKCMNCCISYLISQSV